MTGYLKQLLKYAIHTRVCVRVRHGQGVCVRRGPARGCYAKIAVLTNAKIAKVLYAKNAKMKKGSRAEARVALTTGILSESPAVLLQC